MQKEPTPRGDADASQTEMHLGPVGIVRGGYVCPTKNCGLTLPPESTHCPCCGRAREGMAGLPYPEGKLERYGWVFDQSIANPSAKAVLFALVHHDRPGGAIYPGQDRLAQMTGFSPRAVWSGLKWLQAHGWIERHRRHRRGHRTSDSFTIRQPGESLLAPPASSLLAPPAREGVRG